MPDSSRTSRRTADSSDSPGSTKPAKVEKRPAGQLGWRPNKHRSPSTTIMITAGSVRGNCSLPQPAQRARCPACSIKSLPPQPEQCLVRASHSAMPTACTAKTPSSPSISAANPRKLRHPGPSDSVITAKRTAPSRSPSNTLTPAGARSAGSHSKPASLVLSRPPETAKTSVCGSAQRAAIQSSSMRRCATRSWGRSDSAIRVTATPNC